MIEQPPAWAEHFRAGLHTFIEHYHRHQIECDAPIPDEPCLIIGNHGFGGVFDLNVISMSRTLENLTDRPLLYLVHQIAWTLGTGSFVEALGCKPASATNASEGLTAGQHVVAFPGGDIDAAKPWSKRNQIQFGGRSGYACLAVEHDLPIIPVVTAGAGESLFVISDGQRLAGRLGLHKYRVKTLPVSLSLPWGINVGVAGMLPYLPFPAKLMTAVLPAMRPGPDENPAAFAHRIERAMQDRLDGLTARRKPFLG